MKIRYQKKFDKRFAKLNEKLQRKVIRAVERFQVDPFTPSLKNHPLKGSMFGKRSISVTGDLRIIFEEYDGYVLVVMLDVGTHPQVYGE